MPQNLMLETVEGLGIAYNVLEVFEEVEVRIV